ncbi:MAG: hypothetical protein JRC86_07490, partial [Deltaproteobacteria bacterium]|nr:hypothetical protein [Deltaproteobacteria bacterium]
ILRNIDGVVHFGIDDIDSTVTITYDSDITSAEKIGATLSLGGFAPLGPPRTIE